tara:strand:- start:9876 stop:10637 length:762 start_codon:yes stop_codon:yes gene_type:complete
VENGSDLPTWRINQIFELWVAVRQPDDGKKAIMRTSPNILVAVLICAAAAGMAFLAQTGNSQESAEVIESSQADAVFAGGCFWCTEADFDKLDGVHETISGYIGGDVNNPSYEQVVSGTTGHYEAVRVIYDASVISYDELVEYFWRTIDPFNDNGQFCDRGSSYRAAIFVETAEERDIAEATKAALSEEEGFGQPIVTEILDQDTFWPAEEKHQNFYEKRSQRYKFYRAGCGRDARLKEIWGEDAAKEVAESF